MATAKEKEVKKFFRLIRKREKKERLRIFNGRCIKVLWKRDPTKACLLGRMLRR